MKVLTQHASDVLYVITEGEYEGHEALWRPARGGAHQVIILEKNNVVAGKVKIIDVIDIIGEKPKWLIPPNAH